MARRWPGEIWYGVASNWDGTGFTSHARNSRVAVNQLSGPNTNAPREYLILHGSGGWECAKEIE